MTTQRPVRPTKTDERAYYRLLHESVSYCVLCGRNGNLQVAHRNEGKGMGKKTDFRQTALLCVPCHHAIDNGSDLPLAERRRLMDMAIGRTRRLLTMMGLQ